MCVSVCVFARRSVYSLALALVPACDDNRGYRRRVAFAPQSWRIQARMADGDRERERQNSLD